ncbi:MAG: hypothetical protein NDF53_02325 [archaeon GB-1867-097]|nr:hypothetical protein [Candidatus Culexmicrobium thermophilum]MCS7384550.1 hypothetical protein [Candidatus Culexmicrobium thermophilum]HDO20414.1 hypothetical protein [Candidatus Bathyarchaeota archaeon]
MGRIRKGEICSICGCERRAVKSMAFSTAINALSKLNLKVKNSNARRIYLCEFHYKLFKKATRKDRMFEKWWRGL